MGLVGAAEAGEPGAGAVPVDQPPCWWTKTASGETSVSSRYRLTISPSSRSKVSWAVTSMTTPDVEAGVSGVPGVAGGEEDRSGAHHDWWAVAVRAGDHQIRSKKAGGCPSRSGARMGASSATPASSTLG